MKKLIAKSGPVFVLICMSGPFAPLYRAQSDSATRVITVPDGLNFKVDNQFYQHAMSALWPAGTSHSLVVEELIQYDVLELTRFVFSGWEPAAVAGGNRISITASPYIKEYRATFETQYAITFRFLTCASAGQCQGNGSVLANGITVSADQKLFLPAGTVALKAVPDPGYAFAGWLAGRNQPAVTGLNTFPLKAPVTLYPSFVPARPVQFTTSPPNLSLLVDRGAVATPWAAEWGWGTTHTLDVLSPQVDQWGKTWVFQAWSDGGAAQHSYTVAEQPGGLDIVATYARAIGVNVVTSPRSLTLTIDGHDAPPPYYFWWLAGDMHRLAAPAQQTDSQGRMWSFSGWSNDASAAQEFTVPDQDTWVTATYQPVGHLTVYGTVAGLSVKVDGTDCAVPCDVQRPAGTEVRVSAPAMLPSGEASRADFTGWTGSGPSGGGEWVAALTGDPQAIWANYRTMNRLSAVSEPAGGASWTIAPASPDGYYDSQTTVKIAAAALPGYRFRQWGGDLSGADSPGAVRMDAPRVVRALLDQTPYIAPAGVVNGAGATPAPEVAAGSVVSVFGASLGADTAVGPDSPLVQTLAGVTAKVGDRLAPLFFVSPGQINLQLPSDLSPGPQTLTINSQGLGDVSAEFTVVRNAPGLFQQSVKDQLLALALHEDGTLVTPEAPARRGELLSLYATGLGPLAPARLEGLAAPADPLFQTVDGISVLAGEAVIAAESAFAAPGRVGVDIVRFRLPADVPAATPISLAIRVGGRTSNAAPAPVE
ncbi:MAG: hypothetical protein LAQ30_19880 [Acidobacteriia bacterium]|nr:hypothetical protein [Terriglobia bacterium]